MKLIKGSLFISCSIILLSVFLISCDGNGNGEGEKEIIINFKVNPANSTGDGGPFPDREAAKLEKFKLEVKFTSGQTNYKYTITNPDGAPTPATGNSGEFTISSNEVTFEPSSSAAMTKATITAGSLTEGGAGSTVKLRWEDDDPSTSSPEQEEGGKNYKYEFEFEVE